MTTPTQAIRLVCSLENASNRIGEIFFATVEGERGPIHVSERVSQEVAERLLRIPGFARYEGSDDRAIDAAIAKVVAAEREAKPASMDGDVRQQLEEQRRANRMQAEEIEALRSEVARLRMSGAPGVAAEDVDRLKGELAQAQADHRQAINRVEDLEKGLEALEKANADLTAKAQGELEARLAAEESVKTLTAQIEQLTAPEAEGKGKAAGKGK